MVRRTPFPTFHWKKYIATRLQQKKQTFAFMLLLLLIVSSGLAFGFLSAFPGWWGDGDDDLLIKPDIQWVDPTVGDRYCRFTIGVWDDLNKDYRSEKDEHRFIQEARLSYAFDGPGLTWAHDKGEVSTEYEAIVIETFHAFLVNPDVAYTVYSNFEDLKKDGISYAGYDGFQEGDSHASDLLDSGFIYFTSDREELEKNDLTEENYVVAAHTYDDPTELVLKNPRIETDETLLKMRLNWLDELFSAPHLYVYLATMIKFEETNSYKAFITHRVFLDLVVTDWTDNLAFSVDSIKTDSVIYVQEQNPGQWLWANVMSFLTDPIDYLSSVCRWVLRRAAGIIDPVLSLLTGPMEMIIDLANFLAGFLDILGIKLEFRAPSDIFDFSGWISLWSAVLFLVAVGLVLVLIGPPILIASLQAVGMIIAGFIKKLGQGIGGQ